MINGLRVRLRSESFAIDVVDIPAQINGGTDNNCDITIIRYKKIINKLFEYLLNKNIFI
jgi:hypothetical protein